MQKVHYQDDHAEVIAEAGMKFQLLDENMTKSASECFSRDAMVDLTPDDKHFGIHVIAMGSEECIGPNRNGDAFPEVALEKYASTFVTNGCFFREHRNRCQDTQGIGIIKAAAYNKPMQRVELIVWGDKEKAAEEYALAKSGSELSFSMSARMPSDRCSICGQESTRITDYCSHLKDNMLQYDEGMKKYAYAVNDNNLKFFDISRVHRPADRIAHYISYKFGDNADMAKAASAAGLVIPGASWAEFEGVDIGGKTSDVFDAYEEATLVKLANAEQDYVAAENGQLNDPITKSAMFDVAPAAMAGADLTQSEIDTFSNMDVPSVLGELTKAGCIMPFPSFASLISGQPRHEIMQQPKLQAVIRIKLPTLFSGARSKGCGCGDVANMVTPSPYGCMFQPHGDAVEDIMSRSAKRMGMETPDVQQRAMHVTVIKQAAIRRSETSDEQLDGYYSALADGYAVYVVKAANTMLSSSKSYSMLPMLVTAKNRM